MKASVRLWVLLVAVPVFSFLVGVATAHAGVDLVPGQTGNASPSVTQPGATVTLVIGGGSFCNLSYTCIKNSGTSTSGPFSIDTIYLDQNYDGVAEYTVPATATIASLAPNGMATFNVLWTVPADAPYGPYRIGYFVDPANAVSETDETNNFSGWRNSLTLARTTCSASTIPQGSTTQSMSSMQGGCAVGATAYNSTSGACTAGYTGSCTYRCSGTSGGYTSSGLITSDWTASGSDFVCVPTSSNIDLKKGTPYVYTVIQYGSSTYTGVALQGMKSILYTGNITNVGTATSSAFTIGSFEIDYIGDGTQGDGVPEYTVAPTSSVTTLGPGVSSALSMSWQVPESAPVGLYRFRYMVDQAGAVVESNEINNQSAWVSFEIRGTTCQAEVIDQSMTYWPAVGTNVPSMSSVPGGCVMGTANYMEPKIGSCNVGYTGWCGLICNVGENFPSVSLPNQPTNWTNYSSAGSGACAPLPVDIEPGTPLVSYMTTDGDSAFAPRGDVVTLRSGTIQNTGTGNTQPFEVDFYIDFNNDGVAEYTVPISGDVATITPGGTTEVTASWTVPLDAPLGAYRISYTVDPDSEVSETYAGDSETNNFSGWHDGPFVVEGSCDPEVVSGDFTGGCVVDDAQFYETSGSCNTGYTGSCTYQCMGWNGTTYESVLKNSNWDIEPTPGDECRAMSIDVFRVCSSDLTHCAETGETLTVDVSTPLTITWNSTETDLCTAVSGSGFNTGTLTAGSDAVGNTAPALPEQTDTYSIACNDNGNTPLQASVVVETSINLPVLTAAATVLPTGSTTRLTWDTNTGDEGLCTLTGAGVSTSDLTNGTGDAQTGYVDVVIDGRVTYTLDCPSGITLKTFEIIPAAWE